MHMTTKNSSNIESPNHHSFWSYCMVIASTFFFADVIAGGKILESLVLHKVEYAVSSFVMIATVQVYASDGISQARFARSYSRHKL